LFALLDRDPISNAMLIARLRGRGGKPGDTWGEFNTDTLVEVAHVGGNLVPAGGEPSAAGRLGAFLATMPRRAASIVGTAAEVEQFWRYAEPQWGPAREERLNQPLLVACEPATVAPDERVRWARVEDADDLYEPTVAMFTEEVGVSPLIGSSEAAYRARLLWLIRSGRVLCRYDARGVVFKAELAAVTPHTCQVQGVWVRPDARGQGVGSAAMVALVAKATELAPTVSLYVNHYNTAALTAYQRSGFRQVGTMASIHF